MISEQTRKQLAALKISSVEPLIICDVDEVVVHFIREFEDFISTEDLKLKHGNPAEPYVLYENKTKKPVSLPRVSSLIDAFFEKRTRNMKPIIGAVEGLQTLNANASVVMLTNLPHFAGDDRRANLADLGLDHPVITNSGPKGPAILDLASRTKAPVVFIDDSQNFIQSAYDHAPHVHLIHFLHDERFSKYVPKLEYVSLRTDNWVDVKAHMNILLKR